MSIDIQKLLKDVETLIRNPELAIGGTDVETLKKTLKHIKCYALFKEVGKSVMSMPEVVQDIEETRNSLLAKLVQVRRDSSMEVFREYYEEQLEKLESVGASLTNPDKLAESMTLEYGIEEEELVQMCALATAHGYNEAQEFQKRPIFENNGTSSFQKFAVSNEQAKKFIAFIRNEGLMAELSAEFEREAEREEQSIAILEEIATIQDETPFFELQPMLNNPEFEEAISDIREFAANAPKDSDLPAPTSKNKLFDRVRSLLPDKMFPHEKAKQKKLQDEQKKKREEYIEKASQKINKKMVSQGYKDVIDFFMKGGGYSTLLNYPDLDSQELRKSITTAYDAISELNKTNSEIIASITEDRMQLSEDAKIALGYNGTSEVKAMVYHYYKGEDLGDEKQVKQHLIGQAADVSRVGASLCLAMLLERDNISIDDISAIWDDKNSKLPNLDTYVATTAQKIRRQAQELRPEREEQKHDSDFDEM